MTPQTPDSRLWDMAMKATVPISIILAGTLITHEVRISNMEATRFTSADAKDLEARVNVHPDPPEWLRTQVSEIRNYQQDILRRITVIETKMEQK